jgi:hypothetical protein
MSVGRRTWRAHSGDRDRWLFKLNNRSCTASPSDHHDLNNFEFLEFVYSFQIECCHTNLDAHILMDLNLVEFFSLRKLIIYQSPPLSHIWSYGNPNSLNGCHSFINIAATIFNRMWHLLPWNGYEITEAIQILENMRSIWWLNWICSGEEQFTGSWITLTELVLKIYFSLLKFVLLTFALMMKWSDCNLLFFQI